MRDKRTMTILLLMPIILIILFGYAITTEIKQSPFVVLDNSFDTRTNQLIEQLQASEYFTLYSKVSNVEEIENLFRQGKIRMALVVSPTNDLQILADATDPNEAAALIQYAQAILSSQLSTFNFQLSTHLLYNPQMKSAYNFVPGVMGLILILICAMMTSVGIVKEKEMGTMEVLLVSPMKPVYIVLAKATPYLLISLINIITILLLSRFLLEVPIVGSIWLVLGLSVLYALVALSLGLLISTITDTQQAAMLISWVVLMLPVMLLSGMIFPIENMPWILQIISDIVPAKWYIIAVKDVMIKGLGAETILKEIGILALMFVTLTALSVKRFKIRL
ncbi:transport permease protein [Bacteroidia bacterium]|nr:transport permease protein [Bacteroidia bacterium]